jgi:GntR family transcriptional regulator
MTESHPDIAELASRPIPPGTAKYEHLRACIASAIENGRWPSGLQLPPELEIAARTRFSLGTVQRALRELVGQGYLIRRQGSGTFVADRGLRMQEPLHCRFVPYEGADVLPVYTRLLSRHRTKDTGPWSSVLGPDPMGAIVLERTLEVGGRFRVASRMYMNATRFGMLMGMPRRRFDGVNIKKLLAQEFGIHVRRVEQRIRIERPDEHIRDWLGGPEPDAVLAIRAIGVNSDEQAVYYQLLWAPPSEEELLVKSLVD